MTKCPEFIGTAKRRQRKRSYYNAKREYSRYEPNLPRFEDFICLTERAGLTDFCWVVQSNLIRDGATPTQYPPGFAAKLIGAFFLRRQTPRRIPVPNAQKVRRWDRGDSHFQELPIGVW